MILRNSKRVRSGNIKEDNTTPDNICLVNDKDPIDSPIVAHLSSLPPPIVVTQYVPHQLQQQIISMAMQEKDKPIIKQVEELYTNEVIIPSLVTLPCYIMKPPSGGLDTSMDDFLEQEGINIPYYVGDIEKLDAFTREVHRLVVLYTNESIVITHECDRYTARLINILKDQAKSRYISQEEIDIKVKLVQFKFENVRATMRATVCAEVKRAVARYGYRPKKHQKKCFQRKVTRILNSWFCDHLTNPYPTDAEKQALSQLCGLSLTQICNWFANKRIRHMRASKEQDSKNHPTNSNTPTSSASN